MEDFEPPQSREPLANGNDGEGSGDEEHDTPKEDKMDLDDPGSGGARARGGAVITRSIQAGKTDLAWVNSRTSPSSTATSALPARCVFLTARPAGSKQHAVSSAVCSFSDGYRTRLRLFVEPEQQFLFLQ